METFDKIIDFTRTTSGSYVDSDGKIKVTPASRNLLTYTQEFDSSTWSKAATVAYPFDPALATYGPELVTNGDFASGTTAWSGNANATLSVVSGALRVTAVANGTAYASQGITTVPGLTYRITVTYVTDALAGNAFLYAGTAAGLGNIANLTIGSTLGAYTLYFVATGTTTYISVSNSALGLAGEYFDFDNISIREVIGGLITAPDGTLTADAVLPTATTAAHNVQQAGGGSWTPLTLSVYAKAGSHAFMQLSHGSALAIYANFNLLTGTVGTVGASATATITPAGDGWYRCAMTFTPGAAASSHINHITSATAVYRESWAATGTESIYLWGAQLEAVPDANLVLGPERVSSPTITAINANGTVSVVGDTITCTCTTAGVFGFTIAGLNAVVGQSYRLSVNLLTNSASRLMFADIGGYTIGHGTATGVIVRASANATSAATYGLYATSAQIGNTFSVSLSSLSVRQITGTTGIPTDYTRNAGGLYPPRFDYDPVTLAPRGLLIEEQRTNLLLRSEEFENAAWTKSNVTVTANAGMSPDGTADADLLVENTATAAHDIYIGATLTAASHTFSVYAKPNGRSWVNLFVFQSGGATNTVWFNVSSGTIGTVSAGATATITPAGNGWYRCSITFTALAAGSSAYVRLANGNNVSTYTGDGTSGIYVWGAQLEAGAFPTSYIPTVASQVTRAADIATITGANFSNWYNQSEGTFVVEASLAVAGYDCYLVTAFGAAGIGIRRFSSNAVVGYNRVGGINDVNGVGNFTSGTLKAAYAVKSGDQAASLNGAAPATNAITFAQAQTQLNIGFLGGGGTAYLNGHIRSIKYWPTRLSNTQLQALTA